MIARRSQRALADLHSEIRACTRCADAGYIPRALPIVAGKASDRIMIVGQAPGEVELTTGLPFSGRAGAELRRWLARAGIDGDHLPYRTSITKCFPGKARTGAGDRRPSPPEIALCAPWLLRETMLVRPRIVLLVGGLAIERLWGKVPLHEAVGKVRRDGERVLIPLPHPSGASRWLNDPANRAQLGRALAILRREARGLTLQQAQSKSLQAGDAHRSDLRRSRSGDDTAALRSRRLRDGVPDHGRGSAAAPRPSHDHPAPTRRGG